ncbi:MAG: DUF3775 domain-containing protein [Gammaproteobacteria bacterium]
MLNVNPETVTGIIDRAREFHAKESVVIPQTAGSYSEDWAMQTLANHRDDATFQEARLAIAALDADQQAELVALMWIGRGDFGADEWAQALAEALARANSRTADYLLGTPLVAIYLEEGLLAVEEDGSAGED